MCYYGMIRKSLISFENLGKESISFKWQGEAVALFGPKNMKTCKCVNYINLKNFTTAWFKGP